jgi:hypothetical protein
MLNWDDYKKPEEVKKSPAFHSRRDASRTGSTRR